MVAGVAPTVDGKQLWVAGGLAPERQPSFHFGLVEGSAGKICLDYLQQSLAGGFSGIGEAAGAHLVEMGRHGFIGLHQEIVLAFEMVRDQAAGNACLLADALDREAAHAAFGQAGNGRLDQLPLADKGVFAGEFRRARAWLLGRALHGYHGLEYIYEAV